MKFLNRQQPEPDADSAPYREMLQVRITDGLAAAILNDLGAVPPEHGGAIVGIGDLGHLLVADTKGRYSPASWDISAELSQAVGELESASQGTLIGTVHSHPGGFCDPSDTDVRTTTLALEMNPHLHGLWIAVVTVGKPRPYDLPLGTAHRMSVHVLRRRGNGVELLRASVTIVPLMADLSHADLHVCSGVTIDSWKAALIDQVAPLAPVLMVDGRNKLLVKIPSARPRAILFDELYPLVSPVAVAPDQDAQSAVRLLPLPSTWDSGAAAGPQLGRLARAAAGNPLDGSFDRVAELVGTLSDRKAVIVGAGSVGSRIAEDLVRSGLGTVTIVDPDLVEAANLARSVYTVDDVGFPKVQALARRLQSINPGMTVNEVESDIAGVGWDELLSGADLVVAATDDMQQQAYLNHHVYASGRPLLACALYRRAAAGEIVISIPAARTACWSCAVGAATDAGGRRPDTNYGLGGRLVGEAALGPAINMVASVASQQAIGLLAGPDSLAGTPLVRLAQQGRTLGLVATSPGWDFFPDLFGAMDHQFEPQSVWVVVKSLPGCPVCGEHRQKPLTAEEGADVVAALQELVLETAAEDTEESGESETLSITSLPDSAPPSQQDDVDYSPILQEVVGDDSSDREEVHAAAAIGTAGDGKLESAVTPDAR